MMNLDKFDRYDQMLDAADFDLLRRRRAPREERSELFAAKRERRLSRDEWKRDRAAARRIKHSGVSL